MQNLPYMGPLSRWGDILSAGQFIHGVLADFTPEEPGLSEAQGHRGPILVIPMTVNGRFFGFVGFDKLPQRPLLVAGRRGALSAAAASVSLWHERRLAEANLWQALQRTEAMYKIGNVMATATEMQSAFETVLLEFLRLMDIFPICGSINLFEHHKGYSRVQTLVVNGAVARSKISIPAIQDLVGRHIMEHKEVVQVDDVATHPLTKHAAKLWQPSEEIRRLLFIPLLTSGGAAGTIVVGAPDVSHTFSPENLEIGRVVADQLAIWFENRQLLAATQHRSERLQTAAEVSRAASSILEADELINTSVNLIRDHFNFYYVGLFLLDEAREWAVLRAGTGRAGRIQLARNHRLKVGGESMIGWSIAHRRARIALDVGKDAVHFRNPILPDTHSEMALPLISRDEALGALTVQSVERGAFSDEDITLLQTMADQLANALTNAQLFERAAQARAEAEERLAETQLLQKFSQNVAATLEVNEIVNIFCQVCTTQLKFEYVQVSLVDKAQHQVRAIGGMGVSAEQLEQAVKSLDSHDIMADIVRTGQTEVITGWDDRFDPDMYRVEGHAEWIRLFVPITLRQENIGLVEAGFNRSRSSTISEVQLRQMKALITQTALALENAQRYQVSWQTARREALIKEITTKVRASTNLDTILQTTVQEVGHAIDSKRVYIQIGAPPPPPSAAGPDAATLKTGRFNQ
jgi:GAF domain-containing protein